MSASANNQVFNLAYTSMVSFSVSQYTNQLSQRDELRQPVCSAWKVQGIDPDYWQDGLYGKFRCTVRNQLLENLANHEEQLAQRGWRGYVV